MSYATKATIFGLNLKGQPDSLDNGVGFMGANTRDPNLVGFSIPVEAFAAKYGGVSEGKRIIREQGAPMLEVTNPKTGQTVQGPLVDIGPGRGPQSRGVGLDATYGAAQQLGLTGMDGVTYNFVSAPGATGDYSPGQYGTQASPGQQQMVNGQPFSPGAGEMVIPLPPENGMQAPEVQNAFQLPSDVQNMRNNVSTSPQAVNPGTAMFPQTVAPEAQPSSVVNRNGQRVPVTSEQARTRFNQGGAASLSVPPVTSGSSAGGGANIGTALAKGIPQLIKTFTDPEALSNSPLGKITNSIFGDPDGDGQTGVGAFGNTIKNLFSGFSSGSQGGPQSSAVSALDSPSMSEMPSGSMDSSLDYSDSVSTGTSSGNGYLHGGYEYLKNFFTDNTSSNSTGPTGSNADNS